MNCKAMNYKTSDMLGIRTSAGMARRRLLLLAGLVAATRVAAAEPFEAFLRTHCIACHGPDKQKGDLRVDRLSRNFRMGEDSHVWAEVIEKVNSGEMPPKKKPMQE